MSRAKHEWAGSREFGNQYRRMGLCDSCIKCGLLRLSDGHTYCNRVGKYSSKAGECPEKMLPSGTVK